MCTNKLEPIKTPIAVEIAFKLSQLDVTAIRIFLTEIGNATDNDTFELFVVCVPHCLHTTNGDNPDRDIVPSYIVCFSILDAYCTRG